MSINFGGPRGPFPGPIGAGTPPSGRFRNMYQQSPPPNPGPPGRGMYHHKQERAVTFMPNDVKVPRQPKQPDKPLPAYMRYSRKVWEKVKAQHPEMKMWDIGKLIGEQWRNLPEDERQGFFAEYEVEKSEYQEAMKTYHNSSAYRDWLKSKEKAQHALQEQQMMEKMIGTQLPKEEPRFQLQQMEEDDSRESNLYDGDFSIKHVATARFQRNHKLIAEIFNESTVPDIKSIVTRPRLENLKRQVQSLMQHQRKLESEIQDMEEKFNAKKSKILKRSENFEEKVKKLSEPPPPIEISNKNDEETNQETPAAKTPNTQPIAAANEEKPSDESDSVFLPTSSITTSTVVLSNKLPSPAENKPERAQTQAKPDEKKNGNATVKEPAKQIKSYNLVLPVVKSPPPSASLLVSPPPFATPLVSPPPSASPLVSPVVEAPENTSTKEVPSKITSREQEIDTTTQPTAITTTVSEKMETETSPTH